MAFLDRLQGLFSLAVWDSRRQRLILATDHTAGIRPMYYAAVSGGLIFSTVQRAILAHSAIRRKINTRALPELLLLGSLSAPDTIFEGVRAIEYGTVLTWERGEYRKRRYWQRSIQPDPALPLAEAKRRYHHALTNSIKQALTGVSKPLVMMSGGIDSVSLVAMMRRLTTAPITTLSLHHNGVEMDERDTTRRVARMFKTEHHEVHGRDASCLQYLPLATWFRELPHSFAYPWFLLGREAQALAGRPAFMGLGNDCCWGWRGRELPATEANDLSPSQRTARTFLMRRMQINLRDLNGLLHGSGSVEDVEAKLSGFAIESGDPFNDMIHMETVYYGCQVAGREIGSLIVDAFGLPVQTPFISQGISHLVDSLPASMKWRRGSDGPLIKWLFKQILEDSGLLPHDLVHRRKMWITTPAAAWLRNGLREDTEAILFRSDARLRPYFNMERVRALWTRHLLGAEDHSSTLLLLLTFELLHHLFIDASPACPPSAALHDIATR